MGASRRLRPAVVEVPHGSPHTAHLSEARQEGFVFVRHSGTAAAAERAPSGPDKAAHHDGEHLVVDGATWVSDRSVLVRVAWLRERGWVSDRGYLRNAEGRSTNTRLIQDWTSVDGAMARAIELARWRAYNTELTLALRGADRVDFRRGGEDGTRSLTTVASVYMPLTKGLTLRQRSTNQGAIGGFRGGDLVLVLAPCGRGGRAL